MVAVVVRVVAGLIQVVGVLVRVVVAGVLGLRWLNAVIIFSGRRPVVGESVLRRCGPLRAGAAVRPWCAAFRCRRVVAVVVRVVAGLVGVVEVLVRVVVAGPPSAGSTTSPSSHPLLSMPLPVQNQHS